MQRISEAEDVEARRELLLGQITVARSKFYAAMEAGDAELAAELKATIARLSSERDRT